MSSTVAKRKIVIVSNWSGTLGGHSSQPEQPPDWSAAACTRACHCANAGSAAAKTRALTSKWATVSALEVSAI